MLVRIPILALVFATAVAGPAAFAASRSESGTASRAVLAQVDPDALDDPQGASALLVRVERLESRIRTMTGQIEQLEFQNKRLEDNLRKMQQDVDFRFQDLGRVGPPGAPRTPPTKRGDLDDPGSGAASADRAPIDSAPKPTLRSAQRVGDAFDPETDPGAPGAPKPLGTTPPSPPMTARAAGTVPRDGSSRQVATASGTTPEPFSDEPRAPLNLVPRGAGPPEKTASATPADAADVGSDGAPGSRAAGRSTPNPASVASLTPGSTRTEYEGTYALYKGGQYDAAAAGLQSFIQKYPKDRLVPDATYFLGETFARLGRHREAAEQFLKLSTDYTRSSRAPDALLRLGIALNALGAKDQACATYQEVDRKYPSASSDVRAGVERELKRAKC